MLIKSVICVHLWLISAFIFFSLLDMKMLRKMICNAAVCIGRMVTGTPSVPPEIRRILAVVHGGIGDRLMTLPALRFLREKYADAVMHVVWCGEALPVEGEFNSMEVVGKNDLFGQLRIMRKEWDLLFVNSIGAHSAVTEIASAFSGISLRIGPMRVEGGISAYNHAYYVPHNEHVTAINMTAASGERYTHPFPYPIKTLSHNVEKESFVLLHVGCRPAYKGYEKNRWPLENFRKLAVKIQSEMKKKVVVIIGPDEEFMKEKVGKWGVEIVRHLSLKELFEIICKANLLIGNDSGPSHIAAAVGTPEIILFGPSDPRRSAPVSDKAVMICAGHEEPFYKYEKLPEYVLRSMEMIKVETVFTAVKEVLK